MNVGVYFNFNALDVIACICEGFVLIVRILANLFVLSVTMVVCADW